MAAKTSERLLDQLDEAKRRFDKQSRLRIERILSRLARQRIRDAESLIRYHEILLFLRAYPQSARIENLAEAELSAFSRKVALLKDLTSDTAAMEHPEVSGIAGTAVTDTFSYHIVRWLLKHHPRQVSINWEWFESENRLAETWPRFLPLLEEDGAVEANVPYQRWLHAARDHNTELLWLIDRFESLALRELEKAELYDSLQIYVQWRFGFRASRTGMRLPVRKSFRHRQPLIARRDVSIDREISAPPTALRRLSLSQGQKILDLARETSTVRYRELYGFTHGDPARVLKARIGRGVDLYFVGLPPAKRLPLRAYHAAMIFKNGVPVGYFEGLSLFERMESGFNFYYTFREGETAWIYAKTLALLYHLLGVTAFAIDPYQVGFENEEGIKSGAFWFYRKLGFRPTDPQKLKLTLSEEKKLGARPSYRTPPGILRQLAESPMIFEILGTPTGEWDRFQVRRLGLRVQRRMAKFGGEAARVRQESLSTVSQALGLRVRDWKAAAQTALSDFSLVLALVRDLRSWTNAEKQSIVRIIQAKAGADEARYLRRQQQHRRLRAEFIRLGSGE